MFIFKSPLQVVGNDLSH